MIRFTSRSRSTLLDKSGTSASLVLLLLSSAFLCAQVADERASAARPGGLYPEEWPRGPGPESAPGWARPGRISFARWDGGPLETAKAMLSGWPGFNPPIPDYLYAMTNWYDPRTVGFLRQAGINTVWVTFSNGFSIATERRQRELLRRYIDECHRQGIHVMAYQSIANMFWEDMFQQVPESRNWIALGADGKPVPYGAASYQAMGRVTRYMADLAKPGWLVYLRRRIDLAIDAGADGVMYDNNSGAALFETYREIYQYASSRKPAFLLMGNFHANSYVFNRLINCITTEDGYEPGVYAPGNLQEFLKAEQSTLLPVEGGFLVNNIGLFRLHRALSEGWKPTMIEDNQREVGERLSNVMSASRHQLALAESMAFGIAMELFVEGRFAHDLWNADPRVMAIWDAIGQYNRFFADNVDCYTDARPVAPLAIVLDDTSNGVALLNGLAARRVIYDVLYEHDLTEETLRPYSAVAVLSAETVRDRALAALGGYVSGGGKLFTAGKAATRDERGRPRPRPTFFSGRTGRGESVFHDELPPLDELAAALRAADRTPLVRLDAPQTVLFHAAEQPQAGRLIIHLLNYGLQPTSAVRLSVRGDFGRVRLASPDRSRDSVRVASATPSTMEIEIPSLRIYSVLLLERNK